MAAKPKKEPKSLPERIRPELNVEKWSIWQPANARTGPPPEERVFEREITLADGNRVTGKLTIYPMVKGDLTTRDQRVYYALVKHWADRGRNSDFTPFSTQALARHLRMSWGQTTIDSLRGSLYRLRGTLFTWEQSFEDKATGRVLSLLDTFNLLSDLKIARTKDDGKVNREVGYFRFHECILKNLLVNHTKPVLFDVVISFRSEIAQIIYTHLDLILADKTSYERRTKELFEDLGLEGATYRKPSKRKEKLEPALKELEGKPITTGKILAAKLEPTKDGADFKLVVRKGKVTVAVLPDLQEQAAEVITLPVQTKERSESEVLVRHFHKLFHGSDEPYPSGKALDQAGTLIARHGVCKARHIVDFAHREAPKTKFKAATFGAVLQYEGRAVKDFDHQEQAKREQHRQKHAEEAKRRQEDAQAEVEERAFSDFWESKTDAEREAFKVEAIEQAPGYGLGFVLRQYRHSQDPDGPAAKRYLRMLLMGHFTSTVMGPGLAK